MSRRSKARHAERRAKQQQPAPPRPSYSPPQGHVPANRGTFRVAQANRVLASELPGVVTNSTRNRTRQGASPSAAALTQQAGKPTGATRVARQAAPLGRVSEPAKRTAKAVQKKPTVNSQKVTPRPGQPIGLDKPLPRCKSRPVDNRRKSGGSASGKSFVPWC